MVKVRECADSRNPSKDLPEKVSQNSSAVTEIRCDNSSGYVRAVQGYASHEDQLQTSHKQRYTVRIPISLALFLVCATIVSLAAFFVVLAMYNSILHSHGKLEKANQVLQNKINAAIMELDG